MLSGTVPSNLLPMRSKVFRLDRLEKFTLLRLPLKLFLLRLIVMRCVQLLRADGSSPDMLLSPKWRSCSLLSWPIESGIHPVMLFPSRSRVDRFLRFTMSVPLITPFNSLFGKERYSNEVALKRSPGRFPLRLL
ncbi:hypothetical protein DAI22_02g042801 [Oryza sativa Japonica Group]|nr:hypothetical protein DAI22_02g042801 [Oryza sativa Japonica Group]